ncbi:unnamed protein product, partial [Urochloa humidicola]
RGPKRRRLRRRLSDGSCAGDHADLLCSLPDELLISILSRVGDSRAAVSTSSLSRRWRRLDPARWIPDFGFSVGDHLPPDYAGTLHRYRRARIGGGGGGGDDNEARLEELARRVAACEDRAMEAYVRGLSRFLSSPDRYPAARSLRLEFFLAAPPPPPEDYAAAASSAATRKAMAACLASALRWPRIDRLELYAFPRGVAAAGGAAAARQPAHVFPYQDPVEALLAASRSRLATLHVKNCLVPTGRGYGLLFPALTRLTIEVTPRAVTAVFPAAYFRDIILSCRGLVFLRLVSCRVAAGRSLARRFEVDLPLAPRLRELVLEACNFREVRLDGAPSLERIVVERCGVLSSVTVGNTPRLAMLACHGAPPPRMHGDGAASLRFVELRAGDGDCSWISERSLESFFASVPNVEVLKLCFRSPQWFFALPSGTSEEWDTTTPCNDTTDDFQHTCLSQIVMDGFERTKEQIALVRLLLSSCVALKSLLLIQRSGFLGVKLGQQGGTPDCTSWLTEDENAEIISQLRDGIYTDAEIVLR